MKILCIADKESPAYWDFLDKEKIKEIDLVISCGDLKAEYLSFLATFCPGPVIYVHGNHDDKYSIKPPEGCECIDDRIYWFKGLRILGLGGSMDYNHGEWQFTEKEMQKRVKTIARKINRAGGFDILVTHSPARGMGDGEDLPHIGFVVFKMLLDFYQPMYFLHGHMHTSYDYKLKTFTQYGKTTIVNAFEKQIIEIDENELPGPVIKLKLSKNIDIEGSEVKKAKKEKKDKKKQAKKDNKAKKLDIKTENKKKRLDIKLEKKEKKKQNKKDKQKKNKDD